MESRLALGRARTQAPACSVEGLPCLSFLGRKWARSFCGWRQAAQEQGTGLLSQTKVP